MNDETSSEGPGGVCCLGGAEPSTDLILGLKDLLLLPEGAKKRFWEALGPVLQYPLPDNLDAHLDGFRRKHECPATRFARALSACRLLLSSAARHDLQRDAFEQDLARLSDSSRCVT